MKKGLLPIKYKDHRTYDFNRTFGSAFNIPKEFNLDVSGLFPNQNEDGYPNACTAYTENDIASNEDKLGYYDDQPFTYSNTKLIGGLQGDVPVNHLDALKAGTVYGVKRKIETPDQALAHRRAPYFIVKKNPDYFDGLISAIWTAQCGASVGTPWLINFEEINADGVIQNFTAPKEFVTGHCWAATGVKIINGEQRIICKSWQGPNYGNKGYCYFNRQQINDLLGVTGSGAFIQKHAVAGDIVRVKMTIIETLISFLRMMISKITTQPIPIVVQEPPVTTSKLMLWARAIEAYEGANKAWNNPGALRSKAGPFLKFKTYEEGFEALLDYLKRAATGKHLAYPKGGEHTLLEFQKIYSPSTDGNDPLKYAQFIAKRLEVDTSTKIKNLI